MSDAGGSAKVFLAWSKIRSMELGKALRKWLPMVIQSADPWITEHDMDGGTLWTAELAKQLEESSFGIASITPENRDSIWIHFEAGAVAKLVETARLVPYLLDLDDAQVTGPLAQFQMCKADREGTLKLLESLNRYLPGRRLEKESLVGVFEAMWPKLEAEIERIRRIPVTIPPPRGPEAIAAEILDTVRFIQRLVADRDMAGEIEKARLIAGFLRADETRDKRVVRIAGPQGIQAEFLAPGDLKFSPDQFRFLLRIAEAIRTPDPLGTQQLEEALTEMVEGKKSAESKGPKA